MSIARSNPIRIGAGLLLRIARAFFNAYRLWRLRSQGLQCGWNIYIDRRCKIGCPANVKIGAFSNIADAELYALDRITIGERTILGKGAFLCTASHDVYAPDFRLLTKPISIGSDVWIGTRATVLPGVTIGDGAVVGAMAVVANDVPAGAVVVGNPARVVRTGRACPVEFDPLSLATVDWRNSIKRLMTSLHQGPGTEPE
jgi:acetyltransferase-like isoleucine patch superfamily enzyme